MPRPLTTAVGTRVLPRNKACTRCKQRKMKCDGLVPCAPCAHGALKGKGPAPECKYEVRYPAQSHDYVALQDRIKQLEEDLRLATAEQDQSKSSTPSQDARSQSDGGSLPHPRAILHLANIVFEVIIFADRFIHRPSLEEALKLPVDHPDFPTALAHGICSIGGLFLYDRQDPSSTPFASQQRSLAHAAWDVPIQTSAQLISHLQSYLIDSWFDYFAGVPSSECMLQTRTLRQSIHFGLARAPGEKSLTIPLEQNTSPVEPPRNTIEAETLRNIFWVAYCCERWQISITSVPSAAVDDRDVTQLLPVSKAEFLSGAINHPRQSLTTQRVLSEHGPAADTFAMHVKGTQLISAVNNFNLRHGEEANESLAFAAHLFGLEERISALASTIPPVRYDGSLDVALLLVHMDVCLASLLLHQYTNVADLTAYRTAKLLATAHTTADSVFVVHNPHYKPGPYDFAISACWFVACRTFARFIAVHLDAGRLKDAVKLKQRLEDLWEGMRIVSAQVPINFLRCQWLELVIDRFVGQRYYDLDVSDAGSSMSESG